ncbi:predicted protein [Uncinocarpus reesii 1704]|uniref:Signal peptide peptidase n=1 Tax=Uncinocarpus reesii (strain UAMH 1704) TaxID=336963 RepID=C4JPC2_UNCRE|nr:uncharacterized protein UREG_04504 [Uncinocarpus reesii 1704]EEP79658.1 predicted protein [Uncinocarpus reesii 1704]
MAIPTSFAEAFDSFLLGFNVTKPLIPTYVHLLISALFCIYIGAHASLSRPSSAAKPAKKTCKSDKSEKEDDEDEDSNEEEGMIQKMEGLEASDAIMLPILSGLTLGGLYLLLKHFDPAVLNKVLNWYFSHAGLMFATAFVKDGFSVLRSLVFPEHYSSHGMFWRADQEKHVFAEVAGRGKSSENLSTRTSPLPGLLGAVGLPRCIRSPLWQVRGLLYQKATLRTHIRSVLRFRARFTILDMLSIIIAIIVAGYAAFVTRPWWLINFLGFGFSYGALQLLSPTTFATGSLILGSLFFYDIYFVFYTPMMVTVAQKLDLPIKLLFPRPPTSKEDPSLTALAMLGLGDIVVPGTVIGLALRFDLYLHYLRKLSPKGNAEKGADGRRKYTSATGGWGERLWTCVKPSLKLPEKEASYHEAKSFKKTYFNAGMTGYVLGMLATLVAMQISNHAQPALLYLVPGVLSSIWITALVKGDISVMWNFSDGVDDEEDDESEKDGKNKEDENAQDQNVGSFRKLFNKIFGKAKAEPVTNKSRRNRTEGIKPKECKKSKEKENGSSIELVSFSISLPRKKTGQTSLHAPKLESATDPVSPASGSSTSSSPVLVDKVDDGPPKKRRA